MRNAGLGEAQAFKIHYAYLFHVNLFHSVAFLDSPCLHHRHSLLCAHSAFIVVGQILIFSYSDHLPISHSVQPPSFHSCGFTTLECPPICPSCLSRLLPCLYLLWSFSSVLQSVSVLFPIWLYTYLQSEWARSQFRCSVLFSITVHEFWLTG